MPRKNEIKNKVAEELGINISRINPKKSEWRKMLSKIRELKDEKLFQNHVFEVSKKKNQMNIKT